MEVLWFILVGIVAGFIASKLMKSGAGFGLIGYLVVGVIGAVIGGFLVKLLCVAAAGILWGIVTATVGAMIFIALLRFIRRKARR